ncbi:4Fe-4S binding protein [Chloroflexota bacterium]
MRPSTEVEFYKSKCVKCGACLEACSRKAVDPDSKCGPKLRKDIKVKNGYSGFLPEW